MIELVKYKDVVIESLDFDTRVHQNAVALFGSAYSHFSRENPKLDDFGVVIEPRTKLTIFLEDSATQEQVNLGKTFFDEYDFTQKLPKLKLDPTITDYKMLETIDFSIMGFHKDYTYVKGQLKAIGYFRNYNPYTKVFSDLVVKEERTYLNDVSSGVSFMRLLTVTWFLDDETIGYQINNREKFYTETDALTNLRIRRRNITTSAEALVAKIIISYYGPVEGMIKIEDYVQVTKDLVESYVAGKWQPLEDFLINNTDAWLTEEYRAMLLEEIRYVNQMVD